MGDPVAGERLPLIDLSERTAARFDHLETEMRAGLTEVRVKLGHEQIVGLLDHVIARLDNE